jgi:hypothetical protein
MIGNILIFFFFFILLLIEMAALNKEGTINDPAFPLMGLIVQPLKTNIDRIGRFKTCG